MAVVTIRFSHSRRIWQRCNALCGSSASLFWQTIHTDTHTHSKNAYKYDFLSRETQTERQGDSEREREKERKREREKERKREREKEKRSTNHNKWLENWVCPPGSAASLGVDISQIEITARNLFNQIGSLLLIYADSNITSLEVSSWK